MVSTPRGSTQGDGEMMILWHLAGILLGITVIGGLIVVAPLVTSGLRRDRHRRMMRRLNPEAYWSGRFGLLNEDLALMDKRIRADIQRTNKK